MSRFAFVTRAAILICAAQMTFPLPAAADFINPFSSSIGVAANPAAHIPQLGISRNSNGGGPISDAAEGLLGLNFATGAASVNETGLHASAAVRSDITNFGFTASARGGAGLVNPFILVPQAGFTGTRALVRIPFSFGGTINMFPSLQACPTCAGSVEASLAVDGMSEQFYFLGVSSLGVINSPNFVLGDVSRAGVLEGMLPVNTELYLRGSLQTQALCQSFPQSCGAEAIFGGTLSYTGSSPDAVEIVWGLTPTLAIPEPETYAMLLVGLGLFGFAARRRQRIAAA